MEKLYEQAETGCCPRFDPAPWDGREIVWRDKLFIRDRVRSFLRVPLNFGRVVVRNLEMIKAAEALTPAPLMVCDENSLWGSDVYIAVGKEVPGAKMAKITGTFLAKVFEGSFKEMGNWLKEMEKFVAAKGKRSRRTLFFYTTCPKCARHYGKNYVVILAEI